MRLRFTIIIDSRWANFVLNRGQNPHGEIDDVAFNGACILLLLSASAATLAQSPLSDPGNPGFGRQTIL
jgi:hypothetical protein